MTVLGVEITDSRKTWLLAVLLHVELQFGRPLTDQETDAALLEAVKQLGKQAEPATWLQ